MSDFRYFLAQTWAVSVSLIGFGSWLIWNEREMMVLAWRSRRWKQTRAKVTESRIEEGFTGFSGGNPVLWLARSPRRVFIYRYHVGHQTFTSSRYSFAPADQPTSTLRVGDSVGIFYDPEQPKNAVMQRGVSPAFAIGGIIAGAGIYIFFFS